MAWPELRPLPSWSPAKFAILQGERTVWHKLAVDARNGWSDDLRGKLKELYKVELDRTTFDLEITEIPVLKWAELKRGREGPHDAPLQDSDDSITTVPLFRIRHASVKAVDYGLLYFYGGGFTVGTADSSIPFMLRLSLACKCDVYTIDYSKAPETKWPVPLQQVLSAWNYLLSTYKADKLCVAGDSAGGSLSVGLASFLQDHGGELPAGLALLCPWLDLGHSLPSNTLNQPHDYLTVPFGPLQPSFNSQYCAPDSLLSHPYLSPIYSRTPLEIPILSQIGGADTLMDDGLVFGLEQGGKARIELYGEEVHDFQVFEHPEFPAAGVAVDNIGRFIRRLVDGEKVGAGCFGYKPGSEIGEEFDGVALLVEELKRSGVEDPEAVAKDLIERKCEFVLRPSSSG